MKYYLNKLFTLLVTLVLISIITFAVFQILPGDPITVMIGVDGNASQYEILKQQYGLDKPLLEQYLNWATGFIRGDLGVSMKYKLPVADLLAERIPATLTLAVAALLLTVLIGIPAGIWLARRNNKASGFIMSMFSQLGLAIPSFWGGILLILLFSVTLRWLPSGGYVAWSKDPIQCLRTIALPAISLSLGTTCTIVRYMKNTLLDQMG
ncbi:MAG: ABC transporter permease, partial [Eubacteriales bacterium]|nr:ABC transporter permease [Eubacteriales bacterium]